VIGLTNPPIGEALAFDHGKQLVVPLGAGEAKLGTAIVAKVELAIQGSAIGLSLSVRK
jgi:hypothetical protein